MKSPLTLHLHTHTHTHIFEIDLILGQRGNLPGEHGRIFDVSLKKVGIFSQFIASNVHTLIRFCTHDVFTLTQRDLLYPNNPQWTHLLDDVMAQEINRLRTKNSRF